MSAPSDGVFHALSDQKRRAIVELLGARPRTVSELCGEFDVTQGAVSQHLKVLRDAGLVTVRRDGRQRWYALSPTPLKQIYDWAARYEHFWTQRLDALGDVLAREAKRARPAEKPRRRPRET